MIHTLLDSQVTSQQLVDVYKFIAEQESSDRTLFVSLFIGITAFLLGATWWWNRDGAKRYIHDSIKDAIKQEMEIVNQNIVNIVNEEIRKEIKKEIDRVESNMASYERSTSAILQNMQETDTRLINRFGPLENRIQQQISDLRKDLNEEFYFIRLKSKIINRVPGGLDWQIQQVLNTNDANQYSDKQRVVLKEHNNQWKFNQVI